MEGYKMDLPKKVSENEVKRYIGKHINFLYRFLKKNGGKITEVESFVHYDDDDDDDVSSMDDEERNEWDA